jgi:hypothetical protein
VADKSRQLILTALSQAAASARGLPLFATRTAAGLFPTGAAGKQAAQRCQEEGLLRLCTDNDAPSTDTTSASTATATARKRRAAACCVLTDKGLSYLLAQVSPRQVLEDFVRVLEARQTQVAGLETLLRTMHSDLGALRANTEKVMQGLTAAGSRREAGSLNGLYNDFRAETPAAGNHDAAVLALLTRWQEAGASEDYPLPDLYRQLQTQAPAVSIGQLHDSLRRLHDAGRVYLHPWTGPLYELPEPPYALLVGHEIAYYASIRK